MTTPEAGSRPAPGATAVDATEDPPARSRQDALRREETDRAANLSARFLPQQDDDEMPAIDLGGVLLLAHVHDGELHVSIDLDTADPGVYRFYGQCQVPVDISVQGNTVFRAMPCATAPGTCG